MLQTDKTYRNNDNAKVTIGGRIKEYSPEKPFVWSIGGNWYDEATGAFVRFQAPTAVREGKHVPIAVDGRLSISNHDPVEE